MARLSVWMGAGAVAAGVSAAMIAGADVASADTGAGSDTSKSDTGASADDSSSTDKAESSDQSDTGDTAEADDTETDEAAADADDDEAADNVDEDVAGEGTDADEDTDELATPAAEDSDVEDQPTDTEPQESVAEVAAEPVSDEVEDPAAVEAGDPEPAPAEEPVVAPTAVPVKATEPQAKSAAITATSMADAPQMQSLPDLVQSFVFDFIGVAVTFIAGPPVVPAGSTVTVRSSSLEITENRFVPADWYYPEGDEPPQRIIYLQHGFLGVAAMYSYTAANLAQNTNSIVVVPTLSSNRYARDGFWLGSDQALRATAELLLGDREALTASAIAAGYAQRYGADVPLPDEFALVGHSLGGNLVTGTAGYYAEAVIASGADNHLAGVVLLDAAPQLNVLPDALDKLDGLGTYIPVLELGAPKDSRRVDAALNEHRPGKFNGVVLANGKHLDSMQGGTPLIQLISHLYQGFPTAQNQAAAQTIIDGWVADILDGRIDPATGRCDGDECAGIYGDLGQTFTIDTPVGPTSASVIGVPVPVQTTEFQPMSASALVAPRSPVSKGLFLRV